MVFQQIPFQIKLGKKSPSVVCLKWQFLLFFRNSIELVFINKCVQIVQPIIGEVSIKATVP